MSKTYKIQIKTHTPVRRPMSPHRIGLGYYATYSGDVNPVQDIKRGLENPLGTGTKYPYRRLDKFVELTDQADWRITPDGDWVEKPKSLLERIKARFE